MAHRTACEESLRKRPVDVISRTDVERTRNRPRTSSVAIVGRDNGAHQEFWVDTVQCCFRKARPVRFDVVTDVIYPEHFAVYSKDVGERC